MLEQDLNTLLVVTLGCFHFQGRLWDDKWNEMEASDWLRAFFFGHVTRWPSFFEISFDEISRDLVRDLRMGEIKT